MTEPSTRPPPTEPDRRPGNLEHRAADTVTKASSAAERVSRGLQGWADRQHPESGRGVAIGWFTRYRAADGQLYALLLTAYLFVTVLPAMLATASYAGRDPNAVADKLVARLHLTGATATLVREVLKGTGGHQLTATLIAVASVITFGVGIGRTLQLVYAKVWGLPLERGAADSARHVILLLTLLGGTTLYVVEETLLSSSAGWLEWALAPLWLIAIVGVLAWTPVFLLRGRVTARQALPGAALAAAGLLGMRVLSSYKLADWLNWYSTYYGSIGIVMAIFFWIALAMTGFVVAAALSPAVAVRAGESGTASRDAAETCDTDVKVEALCGDPEEALDGTRSAVSGEAPAG